MGGSVAAAGGAFAGGSVFFGGLGVFVIAAGAHAPALAAAKAGVPAAHVEGDDIDRLAGADIRGNFFDPQVHRFEVFAKIVVQGIAV